MCGGPPGTIAAMRPPVCIALAPSLWVVALALLALGCSPRSDSPGAQQPASNQPATSSVAVPEGYWSMAESEAILAKTRLLRMDASLEGLSAGERACVELLLEVGRIFHRVYQDSLHPDAKRSLEELQALDARLGSPEHTRNLLALYALFDGPIAQTLDNRSEPFLPVEPGGLGKNVYPRAIDKTEVEDFLAARPELRPEILAPRTVVRRAEAGTLARDLAMLDRHPAIDTLHPGLRQQLEALAAVPSANELYAVPYALAYADEMLEAYRLLWRAADEVENDDWELARYLRNRARDLLSNDYESGDAAWVTGKFGRINAQIGAYEVYDDELFGVKAFYSMVVMIRDEAATRALSGALSGLQELEKSLPYKPHKSVRSHIPVGVYNVVADFGQSRSPNVATILPNESYLARRYGRTIMLRSNYIQHPMVADSRKAAWDAVVAPVHLADHRPDGFLHFVLWHEIGHYLGADRTSDGRDLNAALQDTSSILEELKADLVSTFVAQSLHRRGVHDKARLRSIYAAGILRTLSSRQPRRGQTYGMMRLMQMNYYLQRGLMAVDRETGALKIRYPRYHQVVRAMLAEVLAVQQRGDRDAANAFIDRYATWSDEVHGALARRLNSGDGARFTAMSYSALGQ